MSWTEIILDKRLRHVLVGNCNAVLRLLSHGNYLCVFVRNLCFNSLFILDVTKCVDRHSGTTIDIFIGFNSGCRRVRSISIYHHVCQLTKWIMELIFSSTVIVRISCVHCRLGEILLKSIAAACRRCCHATLHKCFNWMLILVESRRFDGVHKKQRTHSQSMFLYVRCGNMLQSRSRRLEHETRKNWSGLILFLLLKYSSLIYNYMRNLICRYVYTTSMCIRKRNTFINCMRLFSVHYLHFQQQNYFVFFCACFTCLFYAGRFALMRIWIS